MVKQLQPARTSTLPASPDPVAQAGPARASVEATAPGLLFLLVVLLMVPGTFTLAGAVLSPYRVLLLALFPFLVRRWLVDCGGRPAAVDLLVFASFLWMFLSIAVNNGMAGIPRATIMFVEFAGGYLIGRTLIRNRTDHKNYFRYLTIVFAVLTPFAVLEMLTGFNAMRTIAEHVLTVPPRQGNLDHRFGMTRAMGTLEHPITWGLIASMSVANVFYIYRQRLVTALGRTGFFVFVTFTSLSTGPLLSVALPARPDRLGPGPVLPALPLAAARLSGAVRHPAGADRRRSSSCARSSSTMSPTPRPPPRPASSSGTTA